MPHVQTTFSPPIPLRSAWLQTIVPALGRRIRTPDRTIETLHLPDGDFLDLAWHSPRHKPPIPRTPPRAVAILTHGLEGSFDSRYMVGLANTFTAAGYLVVAWNMRGCGGRPNRLPSWYHSGQSDDLGCIIDHVYTRYPTLPIACIGISVGGNILCKYLGERGRSETARIQAAVAVSVPLDLRGSAETLAKPSKRLYMEYLLRPLRARIREKAQRFPDIFSTTGLDCISTFREFDARYTAPIHGFTSVDHYWDTCSGMQYLANISTPLLLLTAQDDPFLSSSCFPHETIHNSPLIHVETPQCGGHVGFITRLSMRSTWLEQRALEFIEAQLVQSVEPCLDSPRPQNAGGPL